MFGVLLVFTPRKNFRRPWANAVKISKEKVCKTSIEAIYLETFFMSSRWICLCKLPMHFDFPVTFLPFFNILN